MKLNFKYYQNEIRSDETLSSTRNLIILHGLFGSSKNWVSISKPLTSHFNVYSLDLRNHGDSPHSSVHTIQAMAEDVLEFITDHKLSSLSLLGHSMGGLVSMYFDLTHPNLLETLIIQDISPRNYSFGYEKEINSMLIDLTDAKSRSDVDLLMKDLVPDQFIRQFLQMNLERSPEGKYYWKLNVKDIGRLKELFTDVFQNLETSSTKTLFILGENSEYIDENDRETIQKFFPSARMKTIDGGGHYVHYTHASEFMQIILDFLNSELR